MLPAGAGIGLRHPHHREFLSRRVSIGFVEVHSENFFGDGGRDLDVLSRVRADHPVSLHGVGLSLGSADGVDAEHLRRLVRLADRVAPDEVSEHLCWGAAGGAHWNDLLPLPTTTAVLDIVAAAVGRMQDALRRSVLVENISTYLRFDDADALDEGDFVTRLVALTGCGLLLDLNNVYVNALNHGFDAQTAIDALPAAAVREIHLAGHFVGTDAVIDHHGDHVCDAVWALYERFVAQHGPRPTLIEWDTDLPALDVLLAEASIAQRTLDAARTAR